MTILLVLNNWSPPLYSSAYLTQLPHLLTAIPTALSKSRNLMEDSMTMVVIGQESKFSVLSVLPELTQLHEMVYEVHNPRPQEEPDLEIIFFHGLQYSQQTDAYKTTWMSYDDSHLWLKTWLVEEFPKARILTISLTGMFFYGTPHIGSVLGDGLHENQGALTGQIEILKASNSRRNEEFRKLKTRHKWATSGIGEGRQTFMGCMGKSIYVVEEASSRAYMDTYYTVPADHFNICKPREKIDSAFQKLTDFLHKVQEIGALQPRHADILGSSMEDIIDLKGRVGQVCNIVAKPNANMVFIVGLSGIGKTTLAEQVFRELCPKFGVTCFGSLERFEPQFNCRDQVLKKIQDGLPSVQRGSINSHLDVLAVLKGKKVLMVLDNVQSQEQLNALRTQIWLDGSASRLILTTTNSRLGTASNTFNVPFLSHTESRILFLKYAFGGKEGPQNATLFIDNVIRKCENFPLSLKLLGSYVGHEEDKDKPQLWRELIQKMDKAVELVDGDPDFKLWARLRPCYDSLGPTEQELFLDIATFFCGFSFSMVECIWNGSRDFPVMAWTNLKRRFLASVDKDGKIWMHTQLRDMGRSIACPPRRTLEKWQRVSESTCSKQLIANYEVFCNNTSRVLKTSEHLEIPFKVFESFDLSNTSVSTLPEAITNLKFLKELNLERTLLRLLPESVGEFRELELLNLDFTPLESLSESVCNLRSLKHLQLENRNITTLPDGIGDLIGLESLEVLGTRLFGLPETTRRFVRLKYFSRTLYLNEKCLEHLASLTFLEKLYLDVGLLGEEEGRALGEGQSQTRIHSVLSPLFSLHALTILGLFGGNCPQSLLPPLFAAIQNIPSLSELHLYRFDIVEVMPYELGTLTKLTFLQIWNCKRLCELPESLGSLCMLTELVLSNVPRLARLPECLDVLPCLSGLWIYGCERLENLPRSLGHLSPLERESFSMQNNNRKTSNSFENSGPWRLVTDSWRLLECFLECCKKRISRPDVYCLVTCEEMEKVMNEATQARDGGDYVIDTNVAGELFRRRNSNLRRQAIGVEVVAGPSTPHVPWKHCTDLQSVQIECCGVRHTAFLDDDLCDVHTLLVRVMDRQRSESSETEVESEIEEDEVDSHMEGDEPYSDMEGDESDSNMEGDGNLIAR